MTSVDHKILHSRTDFLGLLWSNSTTVSLGQSFCRISSLVTTSPGWSDSIFENLEGLLLKADSASAFLQLTGPQVEREGSERNGIRGSHGFHSDHPSQWVC